MTAILLGQKGKIQMASSIYIDDIIVDEVADPLLSFGLVSKPL